MRNAHLSGEMGAPRRGAITRHPLESLGFLLNTQINMVKE